MRKIWTAYITIVVDGLQQRIFQRSAIFYFYDFIQVTPF